MKFIKHSHMANYQSNCPACKIEDAGIDMYEAAKALLACLDKTALSEDEAEGVNNLYNALAKAEGK